MVPSPVSMHGITAEIGVFGGSGFYSLLENPTEIPIETPYGFPSDNVMVGSLAGKRIAFLPRHGRNHTFAPHRVNYRANIWAMNALGVKAIVAPSAVGSLQKHMHPGHIVVCDQFVDRTTGRKDTFYDSDQVVHVSPAEPYCPILRGAVIAAVRHVGLDVHETGTLVVINGPRFSTKAESQWFTSNGWHVVGMTGYPEAMLARELAIPYVNLSLVTDFDAGLVCDVSPVTSAEVMRVFHQNLENIKRVLVQLLTNFPDVRQSPAHNALDCAKM